MAPQTDLLDAVVDELQARRGELSRIARKAGISYDTVLRIRSRENDPGYSKVRALAIALQIIQAPEPLQDGAQRAA
jgi:DNA-binding phage protein